MAGDRGGGERGRGRGRGECTPSIPSKGLIGYRSIGFQARIQVGVYTPHPFWATREKNSRKAVQVRFAAGAFFGTAGQRLTSLTSCEEMHSVGRWHCAQ